MSETETTSGASEQAKDETEAKTEAKAEVKTEAKEETSKGITFAPEQQAYINELIGKARLEGRKAEQAKVSEKYKDYPELQKAKARLDELEAEKLSAEEKAAKKLQELEDKIAEKERALKDKELRDLKRSKIEQAIAEGKMELPKGKTIESLLKRMLGTTEEEIDSDIEDLAGFFPKTEPSKAIGGGSQQPAAKTPTIDEQIAELDRKLSDPKLSGQDRSRLVDQQMALMLKRDGLIKVK